MLLKIATTACLLTGVALLLAYPFLFRRPPAMDHKAAAVFGLWGLAYFTAVCSAFLAAAFGAVSLMRKQVRSYRTERDRNLEELIKGSMRDHERRG